MRFLVDESTGPVVAAWLRVEGHDVFSVYEEARGMIDDTIIHKAFTEHWILLTNDKDFGEKVYRERHGHRGVVLLRLADERAVNKLRRSGACSQNTQNNWPAVLWWSQRHGYVLRGHSRFLSHRIPMALQMEHRYEPAA